MGSSKQSVVSWWWWWWIRRIENNRTLRITIKRLFEWGNDLTFIILIVINLPLIVNTHNIWSYNCSLFFRPKDYYDGLINGLWQIHFMDSPKIKRLVNISLFFGILKMEIYVNNYKIEQLFGVLLMIWTKFTKQELFIGK